MALSDINYPKGLPAALQSGREYRRNSPNRRSTMASGRSLQRRAYPNAPWFAQVSWLMTDVQAQAFMGWCRDYLNDCVYWFNMPMRTPLGFGMRAVQIVDFYTGPSIAGPGLWSFSAQLELDSGPLVSMDETEWIDEILGSEIFDITMNRNWPKP